MKRYIAFLLLFSLLFAGCTQGVQEEKGEISTSSYVRGVFYNDFDSNTAFWSCMYTTIPDVATFSVDIGDRIQEARQVYHIGFLAVDSGVLHFADMNGRNMYCTTIRSEKANMTFTYWYDDRSVVSFVDKKESVESQHPFFLETQHMGPPVEYFGAYFVDFPYIARENNTINFFESVYRTPNTTASALVLELSGEETVLLAKQKIISSFTEMGYTIEDVVVSGHHVLQASLSETERLYLWSHAPYLIIVAVDGEELLGLDVVGRYLDKFLSDGSVLD